MALIDKKSFEKKVLVGLGILIFSNYTYSACGKVTPGVKFGRLFANNGSTCSYTKEQIEQSITTGEITGGVGYGIFDATSSAILNIDAPDLVLIANSSSSWLGTSGFKSQDKSVINYNGNAIFYGKGEQSLGIYADDSTININGDFSYYQSPDFANGTPGSSGIGVQYGGEVNITGNTYINITHKDNASSGIGVYDASLSLNTAKIDTIGDVTGFFFSTGKVISSGLIEINTENGIGIKMDEGSAYDPDNKELIAEMLSESINIKTVAGNGVMIGNGAQFHVKNGMTIITDGDNAVGIKVANTGDYSADSGLIKTSGDTAYGIFEVRDANDMNRNINFDITTEGQNAHAYYLKSDDSNNLNAKISGKFTTNGDNSNSILIDAQNSNINMILNNSAELYSINDALKIMNAKQANINVSETKIHSEAGYAINAEGLVGDFLFEGLKSELSSNNNGVTVLGGNGANNIALKESYIKGDIKTHNGNDTILLSNSTLDGSIDMGDGENSVVLADNLDISDLKEINFGLNGVNSLTIDNARITAQSGSKGVSGNIDLLNVDTINIENGSEFIQTGDLFDLSRKGILNISKDSAWGIGDDLTMATIYGNVNNVGTITINNDDSRAAILTIDGDYVGGPTQPTENNKLPENNGALVVNTVWNENSATSYTDSLHITGTASGYTEVKTTNGIIGDIVSDKINNTDKYSKAVVTVDNHSSGSNSFYGFANTSGSEQALLVQLDDNHYAWKLAGSKSDPVNPVNPVNPKVPEAILMPKANLNAGYSILGTLHERVSERQIIEWDDCSSCQIENNDGQVWGRFLGNYNKTDGKDRYDYRSKLWGIQFGYDFDTNYNSETKTTSHSGVMFTYAKDNLSFYDSKNVYFNTISGNYVEKNAKTGHGQSDIYSLGAYHTYYDERGSYLDIVGMFNYIKNKYTTYSASNDKNHAYGVILSAEAGKPLAITNNGLNHGDWFIEPQAQLIYQYLKYNSYKTTNDIKVDQNNQQGLRGRLGVRLAYNQGDEGIKTKTLYFTGNIIHDFLNSKDIDFGSSSVNEKNAKTAAEIGVGIQLPLTSTSYIYFDTRYYHSLGNSDAKSKEFSGTLGLKYYW